MPSILVEAASTDVAIISTNCKHGPSELLNGVDHCRLIEVNNENQLIIVASNQNDLSEYFKTINVIQKKNKPACGHNSN